jgi:indole-3-glycerol phosphate synthase
MINKLESILLNKQQEVAMFHQHLTDNPHHPIAQLLQKKLSVRHPPCFKDALKSSSLVIIAEIKRKSPSKGIISPIADPVHLAQCYISGGANALSILTDQKFFGGHIDDLTQVAKAIQKQSMPILRKDFIIDTAQIAEAAIAGASAVLLMVSALREKTEKLLAFCRSISIDALVEIHDHDELKIALDSGADIIGINNRNLKTFSVNTEHALQMVSAIPNNIIKIVESGITNPQLARQYHKAGFNGVLIGEALVTSDNITAFIEGCRHG